jgi:hypothetical protein
MRALWTSAFALSVVTLVACEGRPAWFGGRGPFALFGNDHLRPGIRMAKLRKATDAESRHAFRCRPLWAGAQQCVMTVSPGDLHAVVDSAGRVIRLTLVAPDSFFVWEETPTNEPIYRYHADRLARAWDSIRPRQRMPDEHGGVQYRWTDGGRWEAQMWYSPWARYRTHSYLLREQYRDSLARVPDSIAVADKPAYARLVALRREPERPPADQ